MASRFTHRSGLLLRTGLRTQFTHRSGLTDWSKPIRFSAYAADPAQVELVRSTLPRKIDLKFSIGQDLVPHSVSMPCSCSSSSKVSTPSVPHISTLSFGLSARKALLRSFIVAMLVPLLLRFRPHDLQVIRFVQVKFST